MKIKVIVIDDHPLMLSAIVAQLNGQADIQLVGTAPHGNKLYQLARTVEPDIVVLDIDTTREAFEPVTAVRRVRQAHPGTQVLILTGYNDELYMRELTCAGALGYLLKSDNLSLQLPNAIRTIHKGEPFYSPLVLKEILANHAEKAYTEQELAVLRLAAQGLANGKIGEALGLSMGRVRNILTSIYAKMEV